MLRVRALTTGYGCKQVLYGLDVEVAPGEIMAVIGANGSGKSTLLKAVYGLLPVWGGEVIFEGAAITGCSGPANLARGIIYMPQGRRVLGGLSVLENLQLGGLALSRARLRARLQAVYRLFPLLRERARQDAGTLSGGQQQMVALARALIPEPRLLLLDEPSLGLSGAALEATFSSLQQIAADTGAGMLVVEQKVKEVLRLCHRVTAVKAGRALCCLAPARFSDDAALAREIFL